MWSVGLRGQTLEGDAILWRYTSRSRQATSYVMTTVPRIAVAPARLTLSSVAALPFRIPVDTSSV